LFIREKMFDPKAIELPTPALNRPVDATT
jgi:hypothetical protein